MTAELVGARMSDEVALGGRLDVSAAAETRALLHAALDNGTGDLVVDLSDVEIIDATGLGVLLGADRRAKVLGRRLMVRGANPRVRRILRVTRLDRVLVLSDRERSDTVLHLA